MKRFFLSATAVAMLAGLILCLGIVELRLTPGMTRQEIEARFKPGRFTPGSSQLFYNDRLGLYMGRRNFLIATQQVVIRLGPDGTATNVSSRWAWRSKL